MAASEAPGISQYEKRKTALAGNLPLEIKFGFILKNFI